MSMKTRNKKKMRKLQKPWKRRVKNILKKVGLLLIAAIIFTLGKAITKDLLVKKAIRDFKARAVFEYEENFEYAPGVFQVRKYYKVSRETSAEINDSRSAFYDETRKFIGQTGDILVTQQSPFPQVPVIHQFITYYFGGHAAIKSNDNRFYEAAGYPGPGDNILDAIFHDGSQPHDLTMTASKSGTNYWLNPSYRREGTVEYQYYGSYYRPKFIGLRVKDVTEDQINGAVAYAKAQVDNDSLYNFLYFLDMKYKFYCTDLVSRAYQDVMLEPRAQRNYAQALNDDGFITSVNDMVLSKDTYIFTYVEVIDDVVHLYYLEDVI